MVRVYLTGSGSERAVRKKTSMASQAAPSKIYIGNLPYRFPEDEFRNLFINVCRVCALSNNHIIVWRNGQLCLEGRIWFCSIHGC